MFSAMRCLLVAMFIVPMLAQTPQRSASATSQNIEERISVQNLSRQQQRDQERITAFEQTTRGVSSETGPEIGSLRDTTLQPISTGSEFMETPESRKILNFIRFFEAAERDDIQFLHKNYYSVRDDIVRRRNPRGDTALHVAACAGKGRAVAFLLDRGAKVVTRGHFLRTALHSASATGHADVVRQLINSCDLNAQRVLVGLLDNSQKTAFDLALNAGHVEVLQILAAWSDKDIIDFHVVQKAEERNVDFLTALLNTGIPLGKDYLQKAISYVWNEEILWAIQGHRRGELLVGSVAGFERRPLRCFETDHLLRKCSKRL